MANERQTIPATIRAGELITRPLEQHDWKVDGLFRSNRKRASVLAGKPGSGKSTLAWQLAIALVQGDEFLGRTTKRCEVLYWQSEETENEINQILRELGYDREKDATLHIAHGSEWGDTVEKQCKSLGAFLAANPNVEFVILETLDDFLMLSDVKENTAARISFEMFEKEVMRHFAQQASFLFLHQMKKEVTEDSGDGLLGASGIRAKLDVQIYIKDGGDNDQRRFIHTRRRRSGVAIPPTYLNFDETTHRSTLGQLVAEQKKRDVSNTEDRILRDVLTFFTNNPDSHEKACLYAVQGDNTVKRNILRKLRREGMLVANGKGVKGDEFRLSLAALPVETEIELAVQI